jgi:hypothetical protein
MGYIYLVPPEIKCEFCILPDPTTLHISQQGSIFQCNLCQEYHILKQNKQGTLSWHVAEYSEIEEFIKIKRHHIEEPGCC